MTRTRILRTNLKAMRALVKADATSARASMLSNARSGEMTEAAGVAGCHHARNPHHRCSALCRSAASEASSGERVSGHGASAAHGEPDAGCGSGAAGPQTPTTLFASLAGASVQSAAPAEPTGDATQARHSQRATPDAAR